MIRLSIVAAVLTLWIGASAAAAQPTGWRDVNPPEGDFAASFPSQPLITTEPVKGIAGATEREYVVDLGNEAFNVTVFAYPKGTLPTPVTQENYASLMASFSQGNGSKIRTLGPFRISGHDGAQGVFDDPQTGSVFVVRMVAVGDHLFTATYGGGKGTETTPRAQSFLNSLRVLFR